MFFALEDKPRLDEAGAVVIYNDRGFPAEFDSHGTPLIHHDQLGRPFRPHRQGRSAETRRLKEAERALRTPLSSSSSSYGDEWISMCRECASNYFVEDEHEGTLVCADCGAVQRDRLTESFRLPTEMDPACRSRPYRREVHFGVRMRQLLCQDPVLDPDLLTHIGRWIQSKGWAAVEHEMGDCPAEQWGPRCFRRIARLSGADTHVEWGGKRIAQHWIQLRLQFGLEPWRVDIDGDVVHFMKVRYKCVADAFIRLQTERGNDPATGRRRNIYNLNYIIAQLLWMECDEYYEKTAKFLPLCASPRQPEENNKRWKEIVEFCRTNYAYPPNAGVQLEWTYKSITREEIRNKFQFFK